jgi:hypothetical protein
MALSQFEIKRCERELDKFLSKHRPPAHIRHEVDIRYRIVNQSVELFEVRPHWEDASQKLETPVAKATYVKTQKIWRVFWHKSDMKWHGYDPTPEVKAIEDFLTLVSEDRHCCFFG